MSLGNGDKRSAFHDAIACTHTDATDSTVSLSSDVVLHLHSLQYENSLTLLNGLTFANHRW